MGSFPHYLLRIIPLLILFLAGCTAHQPIREEGMVGTGIELADIPFFPQQQYRCGPAALATLLAAAGVDVSPEVLEKQVYLPGRQGSLQLELLAATRGFARIPCTVRPELSAIMAELLAGRPVLVLQNLGLASVPIYHYAVVVGMYPGKKIILRSGVERRLAMNTDRFLATWQRAGAWGMVVLRPGELPADSDLRHYLQAVADLESTGKFMVAEKGYRAVPGTYPEHPVALFGLANTLAARKQYADAIHVYRQLLSVRPFDPAATNNLAETLARLHCYNQALQLLDSALSRVDQQSAFLETLKLTRLEIAQKKERLAGQPRQCQFPSN